MNAEKIVMGVVLIIAVVGIVFMFNSEADAGLAVKMSKDQRQILQERSGYSANENADQYSRSDTGSKFPSQWDWSRESSKTAYSADKLAAPKVIGEVIGDTCRELDPVSCTNKDCEVTIKKFDGKIVSYKGYCQVNPISKCQCYPQ